MPAGAGGAQAPSPDGSSRSPLAGRRVVHVSTRYPPGPGGVERHVREVALRQRTAGLDARVVTSDLLTEIPWQRLPPGPPSAQEHQDGIPVKRWRARALSDDLHYPFLPGLYFPLRREHPDLVHVHTYGTYQGFSAAFLERLNRVPWVMTAHYHPTWSIWGGAGRKRLRGGYDRIFAPSVLRRCSRLILQSREEERLLREVLPELPPLAFVAPGYSPLPPPRWEGGGFRRSQGIGGPYILFTGRLASNKGIPVLLDAFADLAPKYPDLHLVLVGQDGGEAGPARARAEKAGLGARVHLTGFLKDEALLASAYAQAEVFALPSEYEAYGLVLLEALAQGTPVVATRVGGIPSIVQDGKNGRLVPPGDVSALSRALQGMLHDGEQAHALGKWGRDHTVPEHTWERTVAGLEQVYREVLAAPGGRA